MIDAQDWEGCPNKTECIEGNRFGKGCVEDAVQSAMGGKPWHECRCGVDCNGNPPNARQAAENEKLRAALEPFATALKGNWSHQPDTMRIDAGFGPTDLRMTLTLGAFRIARAALEEKP